MGFQRIGGSLTDTTAAGMIKCHGGSTLPNGYLWCDGSSYLRDDYPYLFAAIGITFGSVDGDHFNVPDLRAKTPIGINNDSLPNGQNMSFSQRNAATNGGEETHALITGELAAHSHANTLGVDSQNANHSHAGTSSAGGHTHNTIGNHQHGLTAGGANIAVSAGAHEHLTRQAYTTVFGGSGYNHVEGTRAYADNDLVASDGAHTHTLQGNSEANGGHTHSSDGSHGHTVNAANATHSHNVTGSISDTGSGTAHENMQPFVTVGFIIRH